LLDLSVHPVGLRQGVLVKDLTGFASLFFNTSYIHGLKIRTGAIENNNRTSLQWTIYGQIPLKMTESHIESRKYLKYWLKLASWVKLIKQNLQIKTFLGTSENACKSQIYIAMIVYLLLELIRRSISKTYHCFGHFVTLIRVCLTQYNRLEYITSEIQITVQKAKKRNKPPPNTAQKSLAIG
jgi:hypothetical protein